MSKKDEPKNGERLREGESIHDYLKRHKALPNDPENPGLTEEEEDGMDGTEEGRGTVA